MLTYIVPEGAVSVLVVVPSGDTWRARTASSVTTMVSFSVMHSRMKVGLLNAEGSMIARSRNFAADTAIRMGADYVMQIDTDMVFPPETLLRLLSHDKDVVGAVYNKRLPPYETLGKLKQVDGKRPEDARDGGLWPAWLLPGGLMLVKTEVYRRLSWPWYFESYQRDGDPILAWRQAMDDHSSIQPSAEVLNEVIANCPKFTGWLAQLSEAQRKENVARDMTGEDYGFCRKAVRAGIQLWADLDLSFQVQHLGTQAVTCNPNGAVTAP